MKSLTQYDQTTHCSKVTRYVIVFLLISKGGFSKYWKKAQSPLCFVIKV